MKRRSYVDHQEAARRFEEGDRVRVLNERTGRPSKWTGVVSGVDTVAGMVAVDVPFSGTLRHRAEILFPADEEGGGVSDEGDRPVEARVASSYTETVSTRLFGTARMLRDAGHDDASAYREMSRSMGDSFSDDEIKVSVEEAYEITSAERNVSEGLAKIARAEGRSPEGMLARELIEDLS